MSKILNFLVNTRVFFKLKMHQNPFSAGAVPRTALGGAYDASRLGRFPFPQTPSTSRFRRLSWSLFWPSPPPSAPRLIRTLETAVIHVEIMSSYNATNDIRPTRDISRDVARRQIKYIVSQKPATVSNYNSGAFWSSFRLGFVRLMSWAVRLSSVTACL